MEHAGGRPRTERSTHINPEVFQALELAEELLQLGVDLHALVLGVLQEGPELLQAVELAWDGDNRQVRVQPTVLTENQG